VAGGAVLPEGNNAGGAPRHKRGCYNICKSRSSVIGVERSVAVCTARDDKEAARVSCLFCNLTNGESLKAFL